MTPMEERIAYIEDRLRVPNVEVLFVDRATWAAEPPVLLVDEWSGWTSLEVLPDGVPYVRICPAVLAEATAALPWSPDRDEQEFVLDEDAMDDPDDQTFVIAVDEESLGDHRCTHPDCDRIHDAMPVHVHYEAQDSPDPDPYWFFDNVVRVLQRLLTNEMIHLRGHQLTGVHSTAGRRRAAADRDLYESHPALHRFLATVQLGSLDASAEAP